MRISVDKRDRGHRFDVDLTRVRVYLDDVRVDNAVTADEEEGLVVRHKEDEHGRPTVSEDGQHLVLESVRGRVRIEVLGDDGGSIRTPKVKVERAAGGIEVLVYSRIRSGNIRRHTLTDELTAGFSEEQLRQACGVCAGAAAEHLCAQFGDVFDPSAAAQAGIDACAELLAREGQSTRH